MIRFILPALICAAPALASSDDAWETFRDDVSKACLALAPTRGETEIEVDDFGSESYGVAILTTTFEGADAERTVCVYDKRSKAAELTAPFSER